MLRFKECPLGFVLAMGIKHMQHTMKKKYIRPFSSIKLLSTALAYEYLDVEKPFLTRLGHTGEIDNHILKGNLIIKGQSDPTFGSDRFGGMEKGLMYFFFIVCCICLIPIANTNPNGHSLKRNIFS